MPETSPIPEPQRSSPTMLADLSAELFKQNTRLANMEKAPPPEPALAPVEVETDDDEDNDKPPLQPRVAVFTRPRPAATPDKPKDLSSAIDTNLKNLLVPPGTAIDQSTAVRILQFKSAAESLSNSGDPKDRFVGRKTLAEIDALWKENKIIGQTPPEKPMTAEELDTKEKRDVKIRRDTEILTQLRNLLPKESEQKLKQVYSEETTKTEQPMPEVIQFPMQGRAVEELAKMQARRRAEKYWAEAEAVRAVARGEQAESKPAVEPVQTPPKTSVEPFSPEWVAQPTTEVSYSHEDASLSSRGEVPTIRRDEAERSLPSETDRHSVRDDSQNQPPTRRSGGFWKFFNWFKSNIVSDKTPRAKSEASEIVTSTKESVLTQIETVENAEAEAILSRTEIHGDTYHERKLTINVLRKEGLLPKYKIRVGDSLIWFSSSGYEIADGRIAVMAYVEDQGNVTARSYYRSNSQGVWRYLVNYRINESGNIDWYGKGHSEESATLPIAMQMALSEITHDSSSILTLRNDPNFIFAGTSRKIQGFKVLNIEGTYTMEVEPAAKKLKGNLYTEEGKIPPKEVRLTKTQSPNFQQLLARWDEKTNLYGKISIEVFPSMDSQLKFMFCKDERGRAWIGGIEDNSETQSTGLRTSWIDGGDLTTPAYEYAAQTGGYGNEKLKNGHYYIDMFENYLKNIPVIQEYLKISSARQHER